MQGIKVISPSAFSEILRKVARTSNFVGTYTGVFLILYKIKIDWANFLPLSILLSGLRTEFTVETRNLKYYSMVKCNGKSVIENI